MADASRQLKLVILGDASGMNKATEEGGAGVEKLGSTTESIGSRIMGALGPVAVAFAGAFAIKEAISNTEELGSSVNKLRREFGITAEDASKLNFQFEETGVDADTGEKGLSKFAKALAGVSDMEDGVAIPTGKAMSKLLQEVGVHAEDAGGQTRPFTAVLGDVADKFKQLGPGANTTALATQLFGKAGRDLLPFLMQGSEGLADLSKEAEKFGLVLDTKSADALKRQALAHREFDSALKGISVQIGILLIPALTFLATTGTQLAVAFNESVVPAIRAVAEFITSKLIAAFQALVAYMNDNLAGGVDALSTLFDDFGFVLEALKSGDISDFFVQLTGAVADLLGALGVHESILGPFVQIMFQIIGAVGQFASALRDQLTPVVHEVLDFLGEHREIMVAFAAGFAAVAVAAGIFAVAMGIAGVVTAAFGAVLAVVTSPFVLIGLAIGAIILVVYELVKNWDVLVARFPILGTILATVRQLADEFVTWFKGVFLPGVIAVYEAIAIKVGEFLGWLTAHWDDIRAILQVPFDMAKDALAGIWDAIVIIFNTAIGIISGAFDVFVGVFTGNWSMAWGGVLKIFRSTWDGITGIIGDVVKTFVRIGSDLVDGIIQGIIAASGRLLEAVTHFITDRLPRFIKDALGIASPSKVFAALGGNMMDGLAQGIANGAGAALGAMGSVAAGLSGAAGATLALTGSAGGLLGSSGPAGPSRGATADPAALQASIDALQLTVDRLSQTAGDVRDAVAMQGPQRIEVKLGAGLSVASP